MNHGGKRALILVDFINLFDFPHAEKLAARAVEAAKRTAKLKERMKTEGVPCIYANDNFGHWRSEFSKLVAECLAKGGASSDIARLLEPAADDYSVLKPRHSAFYETPLEYLLASLETEAVVLTGVAADSCIMFTAHDAYLRQLAMWVPSDCVASSAPAYTRAALGHMKRILKASIAPSTGRAGSTTCSSTPDNTSSPRSSRSCSACGPSASTWARTARRSTWKGRRRSTLA